MFEMQEDHVRRILIVALSVNAAMANVSKLVKTILTAWMKIDVCTISAWLFSSKGFVAPIDPTLLSLQTLCTESPLLERFHLYNFH